MGMLDRMKKGDSIEDAAAHQVLIGETGMDDEDDKGCCHCEWKTRVIGFTICFLLGTILTITSFFRVTMLITDPISFALLYTIGNVLSLVGSFFLWSFKKQFASMTKNKDVGFASFLFVTCMAVTIVLCIIKVKWYIILPVILIQFLASTWYFLSFFPRIRRCVLGMCFGSKK